MELESSFLSPQPLLKFAPPPKLKKINMERRKRTELESCGCTFPQFQAQRSPRRSDYRPAPLLLRVGTRRPPSRVPPGPAAPTGLLPQVTHGSRICTDGLGDNSSREEAPRRGPRQQPRVPSSPAAGYLAGGPEKGSAWASGRSCGQCSPARAGPLPREHHGPAGSAPGLLNRDLNFTAFSFFCEFQ